MADYGQQETYVANKSNNLGIAGFVTSLVGIASCGLLSPIGFLLSFFALFAAPRGFAVAGLVVGAAGSLWIAAVGAFFGMIIGLPILVGLQFPEVSTPFRIALSANEVQLYNEQHGSYPDAQAWQSIVDDAWFAIEDGWDQALQYSIKDDGTFEIRSAGADGTFGTDDDLTSDDLEVHESHDHHQDHDHDHHEHEHDHGDSSHTH